MCIYMYIYLHTPTPFQCRCHKMTASQGPEGNIARVSRDVHDCPPIRAAAVVRARIAWACVCLCVVVYACAYIHVCACVIQPARVFPEVCM